jgi:hypothetical protein
VGNFGIIGKIIVFITTVTSLSTPDFLHIMDGNATRRVLPSIRFGPACSNLAGSRSDNGVCADVDLGLLNLLLHFDLLEATELNETHNHIEANCKFGGEMKKEIQ